MIKRLFMILLCAFGFTVLTATVASASEHHGQKSTHQQVKQKHKKVDVKGQHPPNRHHAKHHKHVVVKHVKNHVKPAHPVKHGCVCAPKPKPPGGWPCSHTHSCKPHKPHCVVKPPHHHKPPVVKPPHHHKPPAVKPPGKVEPPKLTTVTYASTVPQLAHTGGFASNLLTAGVVLLFMGIAFCAVPKGKRKTE